MTQARKPGDVSTLSTLIYIKDFILGALKEIEPWQNIKTMHTNVGHDIMAGVVVAIIALPLALAFGVGSGLGAQAGLWAAVCGGVIGGLFGGCRVAVSGPTGPTMVQLTTVMVTFRLASGDMDLTAAFSIVFLSGVFLVGLSLIQISKLIYFTPYSVVAGFMCGIGFIVMLLELDTFFGAPQTSTVLDSIHNIPRTISEMNTDALIVSVSTFVMLFAWPQIAKRVPFLKGIPGPLVALTLGTGLANGLHLDVSYIGNIPSGLPELRIPDFRRFDEFVVPAASLAGLAILDSLLTCIIADHMIGTKHSSDRETFGQGLANMTSGLIGGLPTSTATMGTVTNLQSGAKTPLGSVTHGVCIAIIILGLGSYAQMIPLAALSAILMKVGVDILDYRIIPVLHRLPITDMLVFWTVFIVTITKSLLVAMCVGIILAFFRFVQEISRIYKHQVLYLEDHESYLLTDELNKKIKILKPQGPLFFGAIENLEATYEYARNHDVVVIDLGGVPMVDLSGAYALEDLILKSQAEGCDVLVWNASPEVEDILRRMKIIDHIGEDYFVQFTGDAIQQAQELELVKLIHHKMEAIDGVEDDCERQKFARAAAYAHEIVYNPEKRGIYGNKLTPSELFAVAVEDYLIGPEIIKVRTEEYTGQKDQKIRCLIKDKHKLTQVHLAIMNKQGTVLEEGEATHDHEEDMWVYTTTQAIEALEDLEIAVEAKDVPGNVSKMSVDLTSQ